MLPSTTNDERPTTNMAKILIIDDEVSIRTTLANILHDEGHLTTLCESGEAAIAPPVIVISGHGNVDSAVRATRLGAYDFLEKPLSLERVLLTVNHALADRKLRDQVRDLKRHFSLEELLIGESEVMKHLDDQIRSAAPSN